MNKLFASNLHIRLELYEFNYPLMIKAENINEAFVKANNYAKTFYGDDNVEVLEDDYYSFNCGEVMTNIDHLKEISNEKKWFNEFKYRFLID